MPSRTTLIYIYHVEWTIIFTRGCWSKFLNYFGLAFRTANSVDPDEMSHALASHQGQHWPQMSHFWDARLKWVNRYPPLFFVLKMPSAFYICYIEFKCT